MDAESLFEMLRHLGTIGIAFVAALPLGWDREQAGAASGLRTFPLVAVASCAFIMLLGPTASEEAQARLLAGLMTGVGFIGGGAILKQEEGVRGTATAAAIWATGAIGAAVALGRYEIAFSITVVTFAALRWAKRIVAADQLAQKSGAEKAVVD